MALHMCAQIRRRHARHSVRRADRRLAQVRSAPHRLQKEIVDHLVGRVVVHFDLFEHDFLLFGELLRVEERVLEHIREHVERQRNVAIDHLGVVAGRLFIGKGVEASAHAVHRFSDLAGITPRGPLEEHVLDEVRDAALLSPLERGADVGPDADAGRTHGRHALGEHAQAARQGRLFIHHSTLRESALRPFLIEKHVGSAA
jgi:hypothetical protein